MRYLTIALFLFYLPLSAQWVSLQCEWPANLKESSGLIEYQGKLYTHEDSGGKAEIYEVDTSNCSISRTIYVDKATNVDWEDICISRKHLYIGDFGNNQGSRRDLCIYKIPLKDLNYQDTISAEKISFSMADQSSFSPSPFSTNYDMEAMVWYNDSLYLFSKNWGNNNSRIYRLPTDSGTYTLNPIFSLNAQGLISGACIDTLSHSIYLSAYTLLLNPFILELSGINNGFSQSSTTRHNLSGFGAHSKQIEGIALSGTGSLWLSSESNQGGKGGLFESSLPSLTIEEKPKKHKVFPNPAWQTLYIESENRIIIRNVQGKQMYNGQTDRIDISDWPRGIYFISTPNANDGQKLLLN